MGVSKAKALISECFHNERSRLVLWLPVLLGVGIGLYFALPYEPRIALPLRAIFLLVCLFLLVRRRFAARLPIFAGLVVATGFLVACLRTQQVEAPVLYKSLFFREVEGRVFDIQDKEKGEKLFLTEVAIEGVNPNTTPKNITITFRANSDTVTIGDHIRAQAMLFPTPTPALPGAYDFARAFYYDQIGAVGFAPKPPLITARAETNSFLESLTALRLGLAGRIKAPMQPENGPVAAALMVGEMSEISTEVKDAMRDSGLYHVLSISGLHMSLAVALLYITARFFLSLYPPLALRLPIKKIAASIGLLGAFGYLLLAGYPVPAIRSFVMVACVMVAILLDRRGISLYSLAWAATLILLFEPEALIGSSFQLSFAATLSILALYERYGHVLHREHDTFLHKLGYYFLGLVATSLVATLATLPLVIYHFNRLSLLGVLANMLMVPLASLWIMPAAVVAFIAMPLGLEHWPLVALDWGITLMVSGAKWVAALPHTNIALPSLTFWGLMLAVFGGLWLCLWKQRWRQWGMSFILVGSLTFLLHTPPDMLINDDADKVAIRLADGEWLFVRGRPDSFEGESWLRAQGKESGFTLAQISDAPVTCNALRCRIELAGLSVLVAKAKADPAPLCTEEADMLIIDRWLKEPACDRYRYLIDQRFTRRNGALAVYVQHGLRIDAANAHRGRRPWVAVSKSALSKDNNPVMMPGK